MRGWSPTTSTFVQGGRRSPSRLPAASGWTPTRRRERTEMDTVFVLTFTDWTNSKRWGDRPFAAAVSLDLAKADAADVATHSLGDMVVDDWSEIVDGDWETPVW